MNQHQPLALIYLNSTSDCIYQLDYHNKSFLETFRQGSGGTEECGFCAAKKPYTPKLPLLPKIGGVPYNQILTAMLRRQSMRYANIIAFQKAKPTTTMQPLPD